jgi:hypothetical protein
VQLSLAGSDLAQGRELLEQADARLGEAERLASSTDAGEAATRARIGQALQDMDQALRAGSELLTEVYEETGDLAALELLDRFVIDYQRRLDVLLDRLAAIDPALHDEADALAGLLAALHADVAAVTGSTQAVSAEEGVGAARDPQVPGDSAEVGRSNNLVQGPAGVTGAGSTPSAGATGAPADPGTTDRAGAGLVDELTGAAVLDATEVSPEVLPAPGSSAVVPTVPVAPVPVASVATVPVQPLVEDLPCVPVAPLTTC